MLVTRTRTLSLSLSLTLNLTLSLTLSLALSLTLALRQVRLERISPEDLRRCQEAFNRLDVSKNGQLDWRDVDAVRARRASEQLQRAQPLD